MPRCSTAPRMHSRIWCSKWHRGGWARIKLRVSWKPIASESQSNHRRAIHFIVPDRVEGVVHIRQRERAGVRADADLYRQRDEIAGVLPRHIGDTAELALAPEQRIVIELRDAVEVNRVDRDDPAFAQRR